MEKGKIMKVLETNFKHEKWIEVQSLVKSVNEHNAKHASPTASDAENLLASLLLCIENAPAGEIEQLKREKDALLKSMADLKICSECKHHNFCTGQADCSFDRSIAKGAADHRPGTALASEQRTTALGSASPQKALVELWQVEGRRV